MAPIEEDRAQLFGRIVRSSIQREPFSCKDGATPLQVACFSYVRSEQAWLDKMLAKQNVRQPGIIYGFFESPQNELQAYAIERHDIAPAFIAISHYCLVSIGFFFLAALAHRNVLPEFGDPGRELTTEQLGPGPHLFVAPLDPERKAISKLLTMMAMRILTAHEMTHVLNGHIRYRFPDQTQGTMAEAKKRLSRADAIFNQTLEMDADSGTVTACMPFVIFAERDPEEPERIGCHPVYKKPEDALRLWLFAMYGLFRVMEDDSTPIPIDEATHPPPMMRVRMIMGTLFEFLKKEKLWRLSGMSDRFTNLAITDGELAYSAILNCPPSANAEPIKASVSEAAQKRIKDIIEKWREVRPILEPHARGGKLAPLPEPI